MKTNEFIRRVNELEVVEKVNVEGVKHSMYITIYYADFVKLLPSDTDD